MIEKQPIHLTYGAVYKSFQLLFNISFTFDVYFTCQFLYLCVTHAEAQN